MGEENILRYLVSGEGGVTALLATVLDPSPVPDVKAMQPTFWKKFAVLVGEKLSQTGPNQVLVEYESIDLLAMWDEWAMVVESKVQSGSVRRGQLQGYYDRLRMRLGKDSQLEGANRLMMVFVTPRKVGLEEFMSLKVRGEDRKCMVSWEDVLGAVEESFVRRGDQEASSPASFFVELVGQGVDRARAIIEREPERKAGVEWTPERARHRQFVIAVQERVQKLWDDDELHFNPQWSQKDVDIVYANFGGAKSGNVYFNLYDESSVQESGAAQLCGQLQFKVAAKARSRLSGAFGDLSKEKLAVLLALPSAENERFVVEEKECSAALDINRSGQRDELEKEIAALFCRFLSVFRELMT